MSEWRDTQRREQNVAGNLEYLYDVEWQVIRVNMLGTWNDIKKAKQNYEVLIDYVLESSGSERKRRAWRVINYLNAIRMGYSAQGKTGSDVDDLLCAEREIFQAQARICDKYEFGEWDWDKVKADLIELDKNDRESFLAIFRDLRKRKDFSIKKIGHTNYRNELMIFLDMMEAIEYS